MKLSEELQWRGFVAEGMPRARTVTLQSAFPHTAFNLLAEFRGIVFRKAFHKAFEDDSFRPLGNIRNGVFQFDSVFPQDMLIFVCAYLSALVMRLDTMFLTMNRIRNW